MLIFSRFSKSRFFLGSRFSRRSRAAAVRGKFKIRDF